MSCFFLGILDTRAPNAVICNTLLLFLKYCLVVYGPSDISVLDEIMLKRKAGEKVATNMQGKVKLICSKVTNTGLLYYSTQIR